MPGQRRVMMATLLALIGAATAPTPALVKQYAYKGDHNDMRAVVEHGGEYFMTKGDFCLIAISGREIRDITVTATQGGNRLTVIAFNDSTRCLEIPRAGPWRVSISTGSTGAAPADTFLISAIDDVSSSLQVGAVAGGRILEGDGAAVLWMFDSHIDTTMICLLVVYGDGTTSHSFGRAQICAGWTRLEQEADVQHQLDSAVITQPILHYYSKFGEYGIAIFAYNLVSETAAGLVIQVDKATPCFPSVAMVPNSSDINQALKKRRNMEIHFGVWISELSCNESHVSSSFQKTWTLSRIRFLNRVITEDIDLNGVDYLKENSELRLRPYFLQFGTYRLLLTLSLSTGERRSVFTYFQVVPTGLIARVYGKQASVNLGLEQSVILPGLALSVNPNEQTSDDQFDSFKWVCKPLVLGNANCNDSSSCVTSSSDCFVEGADVNFNAETLKLPGSDFVSIGKYEVGFLIERNYSWDGGRAWANLSASSLLEVDVVQIGSAPNITIDCVLPQFCFSDGDAIVITADFGLELRATCWNCELTGQTVSWKLYAIFANGTELSFLNDTLDISGMDTALLSIQYSFFRDNANAEYFLAVFSANSEPTFDTVVKIRMNNRPINGTCVINPVNGYSKKASFLLQCFDWLDQDEWDDVATYEIYYRAAWTDDAWTMATLSTFPLITFCLPPGYYEILANIVDTSGAAAAIILEETVKVEPLSLPEFDLPVALEEIENKDDLIEILSTIKAFLGSLHTTTTSSPAQLDKTPNLVNNLHVDAINNFLQVDVAQLMRAVYMGDMSLLHSTRFPLQSLRIDRHDPTADSILSKFLDSQYGEYFIKAISQMENQTFAMVSWKSTTLEYDWLVAALEQAGIDTNRSFGRFLHLSNFPPHLFLNSSLGVVFLANNTVLHNVLLILSQSINGTAHPTDGQPIRRLVIIAQQGLVWMNMRPDTVAAKFVKSSTDSDGAILPVQINCIGALGVQGEYAVTANAEFLGHRLSGASPWLKVGRVAEEISKLDWVILPLDDRAVDTLGLVRDTMDRVPLSADQKNMLWSQSVQTVETEIDAMNEAISKEYDKMMEIIFIHPIEKVEEVVISLDTVTSILNLAMQAERSVLKQDSLRNTAAWMHRLLFFLEENFNQLSPVLGNQIAKRLVEIVHVIMKVFPLSIQSPLLTDQLRTQDWDSFDTLSGDSNCLYNSTEGRNRLEAGRRAVKIATGMWEHQLQKSIQLANRYFTKGRTALETGIVRFNNATCTPRSFNGHSIFPNQLDQCSSELPLSAFQCFAISIAADCQIEFRQSQFPLLQSFVSESLTGLMKMHKIQMPPAASALTIYFRLEDRLPQGCNMATFVKWNSIPDPSLRGYDSIFTVNQSTMVEETYSKIHLSSEASGRLFTTDTLYIGVALTSDVVINGSTVKAGNWNMYNDIPLPSYSLAAEAKYCVIYNIESSSWSMDGCAISTDTGVYCSCAPAGLISAGMEPLSIEYAPNSLAGASSKESWNVYALLIAIACVYVMLNIWAKIYDSRDAKRSIATMQDSKPAVYDVTLCTDYGRPDECEVQLECALLGDQDQSDIEQVLLPAISKTPYSFLTYCERSLGNLCALRVWRSCDSVSPVRPRLIYASVVNTETLDRYIIDSDRLVASDPDEDESIIPLELDIRTKGAAIGKIDESGKAISPISTLLQQHQLFSVFMDLQCCRLSRVQRLACCLALLMDTLVANTMWYAFAPFQISQSSTVIVGILSTVPAATIHIVLTQMIKRFFSTTSPPTPKRHSSKYGIERGERNQGSVQFDIVDECCRILAYALLAAAICGSALVIILFGMQFTDENACAWFASSIISIFISLFVTLPVEVILELFTAAIVKKFCTASSPLVGVNTRRRESERSQRRKPDGISSAVSPIDAVLAIIFLAGISWAAYSGRTVDAFRVKAGMEKVFVGRRSESDFTEITNSDQFWKWMERRLMPALRNRWYNGQKSVNLSHFLSDKSSRIIGQVNLRQVRDNPAICHNINCPIDHCPCNCDLPKRGEDATSGPPWPADASHPIQRQEYRPDLSTESPIFDQLARVYCHWRYLFSLMPYPLVSTDAVYINATSALTQLKEQQWIDRRTRSIVIDLCAYNYQTDIFVVMQYLLEIPASSGAFVASYRINPVRLPPQQLDGDHSCTHWTVELIIIILIVVNVLREALRALDSGWKKIRDTLEPIMYHPHVCKKKLSREPLTSAIPDHSQRFEPALRQQVPWGGRAPEELVSVYCNHICCSVVLLNQVYLHDPWSYVDLLLIASSISAIVLHIQRHTIVDDIFSALSESLDNEEACAKLHGAKILDTTLTICISLAIFCATVKLIRVLPTSIPSMALGHMRAPMIRFLIFAVFYSSPIIFCYTLNYGGDISFGGFASGWRGGNKQMADVRNGSGLVHWITFIFVLLQFLIFNKLATAIAISSYRSASDQMNMRSTGSNLLQKLVKAIRKLRFSRPEERRDFPNENIHATNLLLLRRKATELLDKMQQLDFDEILLTSSDAQSENCDSLEEETDVITAENGDGGSSSPQAQGEWIVKDDIMFRME